MRHTTILTILSLLVLATPGQAQNDRHALPDRPASFVAATRAFVLSFVTMNSFLTEQADSLPHGSFSGTGQNGWEPCPLNPRSLASIQTACPLYSSRSATIGSTEAARRAGIVQAAKVANASTAVTAKKVIASCGVTP